MTQTVLVDEVLPKHMVVRDQVVAQRVVPPNPVRMSPIFFGLLGSPFEDGPVT